MANTSDCLQSVVKNISGAVLQVSAWPPHGKTFAIGEEVTIDGDLHSFLAAWRKPRRSVSVIYDLLKSGDLEIVSAPNPILYDVTNDRSAMLVLDNDALLANDPCYADTEYSSTL